MSYLRSIRADELSKWLLDKGYAEPDGAFYGISAEALAQALVEKFDILVTSATPQ